MSRLIEASLPSALFRFGKRPNPCEPLPDVVLVHREPGRFDDPDHAFRVLYSAESTYSCILELVARNRPDSSLTGPLEAMGPEAMPVTGAIPVALFSDRVMAQFAVQPGGQDRFLDLRETETLTFLRAELRQQAALAGITEYNLERSTVIGKERKVTQLIGGWAHANGYRGICYESRWDRHCTNWAFFAPVTTRIIELQPIDPAVDRDVQRALHAMGVRLGAP
jgi:hypothetical protein